MSVEMVELPVKAAEPPRPAGILQQNRVFLDFFWDLAKPDQDVRLKAVDSLIQYLKSNNEVRDCSSSCYVSCFQVFLGVWFYVQLVSVVCFRIFQVFVNQLSTSSSNFFAAIYSGAVRNDPNFLKGRFDL